MTGATSISTAKESLPSSFCPTTNVIFSGTLLKREIVFPEIIAMLSPCRSIDSIFLSSVILPCFEPSATDIFSIKLPFGTKIVSSEQNNLVVGKESSCDSHNLLPVDIQHALPKKLASKQSIAKAGVVTKNLPFDETACKEPVPVSYFHLGFPLWASIAKRYLPSCASTLFWSAKIHSGESSRTSSHFCFPDDVLRQ